MSILTLETPAVNFDFPIVADADEPRPTAGPDFTPSADDRAEAVAILNASATDYWPAGWPDLMEVSTVSDWDYRSELAWEAERAAAGAAL